jgi:hypothetical protein
MLPENQDVGRAFHPDEEGSLLAECVNAILSATR